MKALCGADYIRDEDGAPAERSQLGWEAWATADARRMSRHDNTCWHACCAFIFWRNAIRISFGAQPYNLTTGLPV